MAQASQRWGLYDAWATRASVHPQALGAHPLSPSTEVDGGGGGGGGAQHGREKCRGT